MKIELYSYRFAEEILSHEKHSKAWKEIVNGCISAPIFIWPGKSKKNENLDVVQQAMNTYFDWYFHREMNWDYHPSATNIDGSKLKADFRKRFGKVTIQSEVQFGNMSRWYADIFKLQTAYSQNLIEIGLCIVPMNSLAKRIDSNITNFERIKKELPSADLSITLPILVLGLAQDESTQIVNLKKSKFLKIGDLTGKDKSDNRWRVVNAFLDKEPIENIGPESPVGPRV